MSTQMLVELALGQLKSKTERNFPDKVEQLNTVRVKQKKYTKLGSNQLSIKADIVGQSQDYQCEVVFDGVQFTTPDDVNSIAAQSDIHFLPLSISSTNTSVRCTCLDFYWTFAWHNANNKCLVGNPPPPYSKTTNRPDRNPTKTPGVCKHLYRLLDELEAEQHFER